MVNYDTSENSTPVFPRLPQMRVIKPYDHIAYNH